MGSLEIVGEGDPDLSIAEIQKFAMVALGQGGSRSSGQPVHGACSTDGSGGTASALVAG